MAVTDKLEDLKRRARDASARAMYDKTWPDDATKAKAELAELRPQIEAEEARLASLEGLGLAERQAGEAKALLEANQRMADAAESSAKASAEAARWAKWAAFFSALTAVATLGAAVIQAR